MAEFELLKKEKIIHDSKPLPAVKAYFFFTNSIGMIALVVMAWLFTHSISAAIGTLLATMFVAALLTESMYRRRHYWVTNKRVLYKRGVLGYSISSVPLERISDVILSRTFWENMLGFGSLRIETMAGQASAQRGGSEVNFLAIENPEKVQKTVLELIREKRKAEHLTM